MSAHGRPEALTAHGRSEPLILMRAARRVVQ